MTNENLIPEYALKLDADHPVRIYCDENLFFKRILNEFAGTDPSQDLQLAYNLLNQLARIDIRYTRKENQLFPFLEKRGWNGPSQGMWRFQDDNRKLIKDFRKRLESKDLEDIQFEMELLVRELYRMTQVEEMRLFPIALEILQPEDWESMKVGEHEIGWMHKTSTPQDETPASQNNLGQTNLFDGFLKLSEGKMNLEQINLLFQVMPFDLTFVDENDRVAFYNRGEDRVFPRSAGVIGREVRFCHPPKSVDTVLKILEEFKAGRKDVAEFWINYRSKVIHIRYFAVRDQQKKYRGVIEVSQDITEIQKITGEKRLLDWEN